MNACDKWLRAFSQVSIQIGAVVQRVAESPAVREFCAQIGAVIQRVAESPPSPGYEPFLIERGVDPILARMMAGLAVRSGKRIAHESVRLTAVVRAIRFLANPNRQRRAISRRVDVLLAAWEETSIIETIFYDGRRRDEFEFIRLLKLVAEGQEDAHQPLTEIAASLAPHLPSRRGPKVSAASAAHEFFLEGVVRELEPRAFTWNEVVGKCTDPVTEATRREFGCRHFDPRPAYRRLRARQNRGNGT